MVDDRAFARAWVESRQQRRHLSRRALREELHRKGIARELIDEALDDVDGDDEYLAARALAERKARTMSGLEPEVRRRRLVGALARRGFSSSMTYRIVDQVLGQDDASS